jgi:tetratricopeptide (TPR) repeat protein
MEMNVLHDIIRTSPHELAAMAASLVPKDIARAVELLKSEADRHWFINANHSLVLADLIVSIGQASGQLAHVALGSLARGDALQFLGRVPEAWTALDQAGALFLSIGDEVGWARTCIGRLLLAIDMQCVPEAIADAERARAIFQRYAVERKLVTLDLNLGVIHYSLGNQQQALAHYQRALAAAERLRAADEPHSSLGSDIALLHNNMGIAYDLLGDFHTALECFARAHTCFIERGERAGAALVESNMAHIAMAQGKFREALQLLHQARDRYLAESHDLDAQHASRDMLECYLALHRFADARELAGQVGAAYRAAGATYYEGLTLLHAATAAAALGRADEAESALERAYAIFESIDAPALIATTRLRRGQLALSVGDDELALCEGRAAAAGYASDGQPVDLAHAQLLCGQALLRCGDTGAARAAALCALQAARAHNIPALRYGAHLLLGRVAEADGHALRAARRYRAAVATVGRVQDGLTITLRAGFLEGASEALQRLMQLYLAQGKAERAFETLEQAKSHALLRYLADRSHLRWRTHSGRGRQLIDELERLRTEHHWFYRLAHERLPNEDGQLSQVSVEQALAEVATREKRMRAITERLYLLNDGSADTASVRPPRLASIQRALAASTLLIEFYSADDALWAFVVDRHSCGVHRLPISATALDQLLGKLERNLSMALGSGPGGPGAGGLTQIAQTLLERLYDALLAPIGDLTARYRRLVIAPYGSLHYLPFHLLRSAGQYLLEQHEVVIVPAAGLLARRPPARAGGARILAHSWGGRLPQTQREAACVRAIMGGQVYAESEAGRAALERQPVAILHIAAHGEQRLDQPDLSYIQLADAQLYTDDLLQHDLSYELVVLSACETGRAHVAAGDELIGLGRGFLYAGAGALITTLWRVDDRHALALMERLYLGLRAGRSKAAALRDAQLCMLQSDRQLHPAFWGAFQLVGDAGPISGSGVARIEERSYAEPAFTC